MDKYAIKEIKQKYHGKTHSYPIAVSAENIENPEEITVEFAEIEGKKALLKSGSKLGEIFAQINVWLSKLKNVAFTGNYNDLSNLPTVSASLDISEEGESIADSAAVAKVYEKFKNCTPLTPSKQVGSEDFVDGVTGSMSACKIGLIVVVTVKIDVADDNSTGRLLPTNNILEEFGTPRFDFTNCLKNMVDHTSLGCLYVNKNDSNIYFLTPKIGTYYGELIYITNT